MAKRVKVGIIGVGMIGTAHLQAYQSLPVEVVAIADVDAAKVRQIAAEYGVRHALTEFRDLLAMDEIEAVDVCLHNNLHAPVAIAALEAGKHVYCEKPIAGSYLDGKRMVEAARRTGRMLSVQLSTIFAVETKVAQRLIQEGRLGDIYYARSHGFRRRLRAYVDGLGTIPFVQRKTAGGGALFDMGVYHIAQILHLLGNPAMETATGMTHQAVPMDEELRAQSQWDVEEFAVGFVRLAGGISLAIEESWAINLSEPDSASKLAGSLGGIQLSPFAFYTSALGDMEMDATFDLGLAELRWRGLDPSYDAYESPQGHWVAALQGRVPLIDTASLALGTLLISEGIYLSARLGREVTAKETESSSASTALEL